ncbi:MAG TPA: hypothetical protein PK413_17790, partial [Thermoanaerobaculia bacterium]|nr:hypothetical protein [Thermoanaerobaculia bacterium]
SALTSSEASSFRRLREFLEARDGGESLRSEIAARREAMGPAWNGAGLAMPEDTGVYDATSALPTLLNPTNRATVERLAAEYGIDPALLAGVVAAEMDFDHSTKDALHDGVARNFPWILDLTGLSRGVGIASVHQNQLSDAIAYINAHPDHFSPDVVAAANDFDSSTGNLASFEGSVEAAAIVTAVLVDVKRQNGGTVDTAQDMAVIWGAFRSGIGGFSSNEQGSGTLAVGQGGYANVDDFAHNRANGADALPTEMQIGGNAYQSEPYFEYLQGVFGP